MKNKIMNNKTIPLAKGIPIAGSAFSLMKDPTDFFVQQYHKNGSIYRVNVFGKSIIVLSGNKANEFVQKEGDKYFETLESLNAFTDAFDAQRNIVCDGEEHVKIRKIYRRGFSPLIMENRVTEVIEYTKQLLDKNYTGQQIQGVRFMQEMIANQMGNLMTNTSPQNYFDELLFLTKSLINMGVGRWPKIMTKHPKYKKSRNKSIELAKKIIQDHRNPKNKNRNPDLIDDLLSQKEEGKPFFSENDLLLATLSPFMSGMETLANSLAFVLYELLKDPKVYGEIKKEVDQVFEEGISNLKDIKKLKRLFLFTMESMRIHPVGLALIRTCSESFDFDGYRVEKGETIYNAFTVTHFLEENFEAPYSFNHKKFNDIKSIRPFSFMPYGLGSHMCPGGRLSDIMIVTIVASMIRFAEFDPLPETYKIAITTTNPVPSLGKKFTFKINKMRSVDNAVKEAV